MGLLVENTEGWNGLLQFLVLSVIMGGGAAFMAGKALAGGWRSLTRLIIYMLVFTAGVRFLHYALFEGTLTSLHYYIVSGIVVIAAALLGYRTKRVSQMTTQYPWLYERTGLLSWRDKA